ncbi:hypothetical protein QYE76_034658 [Lolium multiflorum]|uniref:Transposase (putative) gypsy type domain-containing protein n=1 Tax=Lolium multiflorum TaxID=4521 RepID=A0AAD8VNA1_LOLMU|nr:hypothetical protein QYE76_034658 [Lolium multiflorum]
MAAEDLEWERSKISNQDVNTLKRLGLMKKENAIRFPSEESYPNPPMEYRVSFVDHLIRGLSAPIHDFLRGLLFVYGIQLQLTPNSILHISIFITLCECFLGIPPNWALWKRIFCLRRNGSHNATYNIGGVVICVRTDVDYFDVKFPDSVQGWRKRTILLWLPFLLFLKMEKSKNRLSLPKTPKVLLFLKVKSQPMIKDLIRIGSQFIGYREYASRTEAQTKQEFDLENPVNDPLLDALSYLELHGSEIREGVANASAGLSALFPNFFPKKEEPPTFLALAKSFSSSEDLGLKMRQENMKILCRKLLPWF